MGLISAVARQGPWTWRLLYITSCHFLGIGEDIPSGSGYWEVSVWVLLGSAWWAFLNTVINTFVVYHSFSDLITISSKLLLSQPMIFAFYAFNSSLQPTARMGKGRREQARTMKFGESRWEHWTGEYHSLIVTKRSSFLPKHAFSIPQLNFFSLFCLFNFDHQSMTNSCRNLSLFPKNCWSTSLNYAKQSLPISTIMHLSTLSLPKQ